MTCGLFDIAPSSLALADWPESEQKYLDEDLTFPARSLLPTTPSTNDTLEPVDRVERLDESMMCLLTEALETLPCGVTVERYRGDCVCRIIKDRLRYMYRIV